MGNYATRTGRKLTHVPPAEVVPPAIRELMAEQNDFRVRHNEAKIRVRDLSNRQLDLKAKAADDAAVAEAIRAGKTPKSSTPASDKLKADRDKAAVEAAQMSAAFQAANDDIFEWLHGNGEQVTEHAEARMREAAEEYAVAVEAVIAARRNYYTAMAGKAWAARAVDPRGQSLLGWNPVQVEPRIDEDLRADCRRHDEHALRHRSTVAGFRQ